MRNKINFVTGETYTLAELFSGNRRIIIPDLQRDYCWGNKTHTDEKKELVSGFVRTFMQMFENQSSKDNLNLGLIYGYEAPENHIQLCDGQQRITTLYLLLGLLNRKTGDNSFRKLLISDYEYLHDDREPYLQYSIRESSLYFLSDLVCHFFVKENEDCYYVENCNSINSCSWFFNEYNYDPSICSMIRALKIIDNILNEKDSDWCKRFGEFVSTKLTFMYYDMENRKNGEETFVVINTTGEPLSNTQNLKPLIFAEKINKDYVRYDEIRVYHMPDDWEVIETWFWRKRKMPNDTADAGFNEFLRWVTMLEANEDQLKEILSQGRFSFPKNKISFKEIYSYWQVVKFLFDAWTHKELLYEVNENYLSPSSNKEIKDSNIKVVSQIDCFQLLPLIAYCKKWGIPDSEDRNIFRLFQFVHNLSRIDNVGKAVNELVFDVILIAKSCKDIVELSVSKCAGQIDKRILSEEEKLKISIINSNLEMRDEIEDAFWKAQSRKNIQSHRIWSGQILPLIEWSMIEGVFDLDTFRKYLRKFDSIFVGNCESNIDLVRRALLTIGLNEYPRIFKGNTNYSFGWDWEDWRTLINDNKDTFKTFFEELLNDKTLDTMIKGYPENSTWSEFVHKEYLLGYCHQKNIQRDSKMGWLLIKKRHATKYMSVNSLHLFAFLTKHFVVDGWSISIYDETDAHVIVVENKTKDVVFDLWYQEGNWNIQLFKRYSEVENSLKPYVDESWTYDGVRYVKVIPYVMEELYLYPNVSHVLNTIIEKIQ